MAVCSRPVPRVRCWESAAWLWLFADLPVSSSWWGALGGQDEVFLLLGPRATCMWKHSRGVFLQWPFLLPPPQRPSPTQDLTVPSVLDFEQTMVMVACGPYTTSDSIAYEPLLDLITVINRDRPDVCILVGAPAPPDAPVQGGSRGRMVESAAVLSLSETCRFLLFLNIFLVLHVHLWRGECDLEAFAKSKCPTFFASLH